MSSPPFTPCQPYPYCASTAQMRLGSENPTYFQQMVRGGAQSAVTEVGGLAVEEELLGIPGSGNIIGRGGASCMMGGAMHGYGGGAGHQGGAWYDPTLFGYTGGAEMDYGKAPGMGVVDQYQTKRRGWRALYGVDLPNVPIAPGNMWIGGAEDDEDDDTMAISDGSEIVRAEQPDFVDMMYLTTERYLPGALAYLNPLYSVGKASEAFANLLT
jgi:hypothetical protein